MAGRVEGDGPAERADQSEQFGLIDRKPQGGRQVRGAIVGALIGTGLVLLLVAGLWGWTAWSSRSSPQVDGQLPFLIGAESASASLALDESPNEDEPAATPAATAEPVPVIEVAEPVGSTDPTEPVVPATIIVHVSGAVTVPGVVELPNPARVYEAVEAVGGVTDDADLERVNLAAPLHDGERIHIPRVGEDDVPELVAPERPDAVTGIGDANSAATSDMSPEPAAPLRVELNRASISELEQLPGVGPATAQAITDLREQRGPYATVDELLLVAGVGPAKLSALRPFAYVEAG